MPYLQITSKMPFVRCKECGEEIWLEDFVVLYDDKPTKLECSVGHQYDYFKQDRRETVSKEIKSSYQVQNLVSKSVKSSYQVQNLVSKSVKILHTTATHHPKLTTASSIPLGISVADLLIGGILPTFLSSEIILAGSVAVLVARTLLDHYGGRVK